MKFLQTFWTGPSSADNHDIIAMKAGWRSPEYHWMSWALSCLLAKKMFGEVDLVTDLKGKELLVDRLQLPYTTVSTALENRLDNYNPHLWALAKIYTYSIQTEPFLHLDGDVFLWHKPHDDLLNSPLIAQNLDDDLPFYRIALDEVNKCFSYIPHEFLRTNYENRPVYASNAGLLGGNNLAFIKTYCTKAFDLIDKNTDALDKLPTGNLNFIFEQFLFCKLAEIEQIPIAYFKGAVDSPVFKDYIKFQDYPRTEMAHPVGGFKKYPHVCDHVAKMLRRHYPEYYYRIIELVRDKTNTMRSAVYYSPGLELPALQSRPAKPAIAQPVFIRTKAAINYLEKKHGRKKSEIGDEQIESGLLAIQSLHEITKHEKTCLAEIFRLELKHKSLLKKHYRKIANIQMLYNDDLKAYKRTQAGFSLTESEILELEVTRTQNCTRLKLGRMWEFNHPDEIPGMIERNFIEPDSPISVMMLPDILTLNIKEYYMDDIDDIIFSMTKTRKKIADILEEVKEYFPEEEIENDYDTYKKLLLDSLKHLLYSNMLLVINE